MPTSWARAIAAPEVGRLAMQDARVTLDQVKAPEEHSGNAFAPARRPSAHLIRVPEAARLTGLPQSLLRKSFMREDRRPKNVPPPPPHKRIGRAVYIIAGELPSWLEGLGAPTPIQKRRRGRPTVAERIAMRERSAD